MAKDRSPTDYLKDDCGMTPPGGTNASGALETPNSDRNNPYRVDAPESPEWGIGAEEATSFGHSDDVKDTGTKSSAWGMSREDQARGYENPKSDGEGGVLETRQPDGSYPQSLPTSNSHDRSDRSREFSKLEEGHHSGHDGARSSPGRQLIGSRENLG